MKITPTLRKAINARVRALCGPNPLAEVGLKEPREHGRRWVANGLLWEKDADLGDLVRLALLREIEDDPKHPGCATLDLYVTSGLGHDRELETNVYVVIKDGVLADAHRDDRNADARCRAILGCDFSDETQPDEPGYGKAVS